MYSITPISPATSTNLFDYFSSIISMWPNYLRVFASYKKISYFIMIAFINRFLLGKHRLAVEAYLQAEVKLDKPDWELHHNLGE